MFAASLAPFSIGYSLPDAAPDAQASSKGSHHCQSRISCWRPCALRSRPYLR